ncbi:ribosome maturation factor RimM, partial [Chloroflexota bacterium]
EPAEPEFVAIGRVLSVAGLEGKVRVKIATDIPKRFAPSSTVYINRQPMTISNCQGHGSTAIIKLDTIDTLEAARQLEGQLVEVHHSQVPPLPQGQYYHFQLVGLEVWITGGELVGSITEVLSGHSNDSYVVRGASGEVLIPAISDVVKSIDLARRRVTINAITGLLT